MFFISELLFDSVRSVSLFRQRIIETSRAFAKTADRRESITQTPACTCLLSIVFPIELQENKLIRTKQWISVKMNPITGNGKILWNFNSRVEVMFS